MKQAKKVLFAKLSKIFFILVLSLGFDTSTILKQNKNCCNFGLKISLMSSPAIKFRSLRIFYKELHIRNTTKAPNTTFGLLDSPLLQLSILINKIILYGLIAVINICSPQTGAFPPLGLSKTLNVDPQNTLLNLRLVSLEQVADAPGRQTSF